MAQSVDLLLNTAVNQHQQGNFQQAEQLYRRILQMQPKYAYVSNLLGVLLSQYKKDHKEAEKLISRAIKLDPGVAEFHNNLGLCLQQQGKMEEAARAYERATRLNPKFVPAWFGFGTVNVFLKKPEAAIKALQKTIELDPGYLPAYNNLGNIYREIQQYDKAKEMFDKVVELKPDFAEGWYNIGLLYKVQEDGDNAIQAFGKAVALRPDYVKAYCKMGLCHAYLSDDFEKALKDFDTALEINPRYLPIYLYKADVLQLFGRFEESEAVLRTAVNIDESQVGAYLGLINIKKITDEDLARIQSELKETDFEPKQLVRLHFSLGKIFDDRREYENAFWHLQRGNELHRDSFEYDINTFQQQVSRFIETIDFNYINQYAVHGLDTDVPVFIVGMPRSGTTLTEQIIASHPKAHGAGELEMIGKIVNSLVREWNESALNTGDFTSSLLKPAITPEKIKQSANSYLNHITEFNKNACRITDKMPQNFLHIWLIAILFPQAKIIHCQRNPMDTCLSIYFQQFGGHHPYAYDLTELGLYYRQYLRLMSHWHNMLPVRILDVQYEELVADLETNSKRLISYIDLPWDERCLQFYETERSVKTVSQWQVRQKIYTDSIERWRHYEPWIGPLVEALGEAG